MEIILNKSLKLPSSNIDRGRVWGKKKKTKKKRRERKGEFLFLPTGRRLMGICWFITAAQAPPIAPAHNEIKSGGGRIREIKASGEAAVSIDILFYVRHAGKRSQ